MKISFLEIAQMELDETIKYYDHEAPVDVPAHHNTSQHTQEMIWKL
jgi:hypothetical protein